MILPIVASRRAQITNSEQPGSLRPRLRASGGRVWPGVWASIAGTAILVALLSLLLVASAVAAAEGHVRIKAPAEGAVFERTSGIKLVYDLAPGPKGHHVHVHLDGTEHGILRRLRGVYGFPPLSPGRHELCVKLVNRAHVPIGVQECVSVTVR
jgi:hypothetical protein